MRSSRGGAGNQRAITHIFSLVATWKNPPPPPPPLLSPPSPSSPLRQKRLREMLSKPSTFSRICYVRREVIERYAEKAESCYALRWQMVFPSQRRDMIPTRYWSKEGNRKALTDLSNFRFWQERAENEIIYLPSLGFHILAKHKVVHIGHIIDFPFGDLALSGKIES